MDYAYDGITGVSNPTGDYGVKQVIETTHTLKDGGGDVVIDEWSYRWDQMYNKTTRTNENSVPGTFFLAFSAGTFVYSPCCASEL